MVSTLETPAPTTLTTRSASSVVSRPSHSQHSHRSKRYNRSHIGVGTKASPYIPQNDFPVFNASGDVEIFVRAGHVENRYLLHRHTLTRCSGFFEISTSEQWSKAKPSSKGLLAGGNELARIGESTSDLGISDDRSPSQNRWTYELDPGADKDDVPMLIQKDDSLSSDPPSKKGPPSIFGGNSTSSSDRPSSRSKHQHSSSAASNHSFFRSVANLSLSHNSHRQQPASPLTLAEEDLLRDYDNLFRIFYNYPPILDGINVADAYVQCKSLLTLADLYDALPVVGPRVDHHLLQFQSRLWKQIAKYPISYLRLGYLARSKVIFQEALIHVVGQWPVGERSLRSALPQLVLDIIEDKVDELDEAVSRIEGRLFRLTFVNSRGERTSPHNNYLDWLVVSLFRQWLADNTSPVPPPTSRDGSRAVIAHSSSPPLQSVGRAYRTMGSANLSSYLGHDECKKFLKLTPELYSRDNLKRFEKKMEEIKAMARELVRPLMSSALELDLAGGGGSGIGYLTCTTVGNRDLPWPVDD